MFMCLDKVGKFMINLFQQYFIISSIFYHGFFSAGMFSLGKYRDDQAAIAAATYVASSLFVSQWSASSNEIKLLGCLAC